MGVLMLVPVQIFKKRFHMVTGTLGDTDDSEDIREEHVLEAI